MWVHNTRQAVGNAFGWNYALVGAMQRELAAKGLGLDPEKYSQLPPGSSSLTIFNGLPMEPPPTPAAPMPSPIPPAVASKAAGWLKPALLGAALTLGPVVGAGLGFLLNRAPAVPTVAPTPTPIPAPAPTPTPARAPGWDALYERQQPDGTWKLERREHLSQ